MLVDGLNLIEGSSITNAAVASGTAFPVDTSPGELFFRNDLELLYVYSGSTWIPVGSPPDAGDITGTTLASNVVSSSLTSVGTLGSLTVTGNVTAAEPTASGHLATKAYVDLIAQGLTLHEAAVAATVANITLSGLQTIDGVVLTDGVRVLVKDQTAATQNGVYIAHTGAWTRATDFDGSPTSEISAGDFVFVQTGTANGGTGWVMISTGTITVGTSDIVFSQASSAVVSAADLTGTTLAPNVVSSSLTSVGTITSGTWSGAFGAVSGANLTNLNAANLTGTVAPARLGSGTANTTTYLRGDGSWQAVTSGGVSDANDLEGSTLAPNVVSSSLTTVGTLGTLNVSGATTLATLSVGSAAGGAFVIQTPFPSSASSLTIQPRRTDGNFGGTSVTVSGGEGWSFNNQKGGSVTISGASGGSGSGAVPGDVTLSTPATGNTSHGFIRLSAGGSDRLTIQSNGVWAVNGSTGTVGQALVSNGASAAPTWQDITPATAAADLTGTTLASNVVSSSLTSVGTVTSGTWLSTIGAVSGADLTDLTAANLSGIVPTANLGTGTANSTTFLRGDGTWQVVSTGATEASSLAGTTLASNVVTSSLTSVGTLGSLTVTGNVTAADPSVSTHLATKQYVDNLVQGLAWKQPAKYATTGNITLSGLQAIDGNVVTAGARVLVKDQTTTSQNGVYIASAGAWTRATDFDGAPSAGEVNNATLYVQLGTANADTTWTQSATVNTVGTDPIVFVHISGTSESNANSLLGTTLAANVLNSSLTSVGTLSSLNVGGNVLLSGLTPTITFNSGGSYLTNGGAANTLVIGTSGLPRLTVDSAGFVGIGKTPTVALDVAGSVLLGGTLGTQTVLTSAANLTGSFGTVIQPDAITFSGASAPITSALVAAPLYNFNSSGTPLTRGVLVKPGILSSGATNAMQAIGQWVELYRENAADLSSHTSNSMAGIVTFGGHGVTLPSTAHTQNMQGIVSVLNLFRGTANTMNGVATSLQISTQSTTTAVSTVNATGLSVDIRAGNAGGGTTTITNLYGIRVVAPTIGANTTITNRWGISSEDASGKNYFAGNVGIGVQPSVKLDVVGGASRLMSGGASTYTYFAVGTDTDKVRLGVAGLTNDLITGSAVGDGMLYTLGANNLIFGTASIERLRIDGSGAIGIGGANYGTVGQVLTSGGAGAAPSWSGSPSLSAVAVSGVSTLTGRVDFGSTYTENKSSTSISGSVTINCSTSNLQELTLTGNVTSLAFSNVPASGRGFTLTLFLKQGGSGSYTVTWSASVKFPGGTAPTLTTTASKVDVISLATFDGGTTWYAFVGGLNF